MKCFANWFTNKLIQWGIIKTDEQELYAYGFWQGMFILLNLVTIVIIGLLARMLWQSMLFTITYVILRSMAGGYHARTQQGCYLFSVLLILAVLSMLKWFPWCTIWSVIISLTPTLAIFLLAPVEDENKPLDETEQIVYRKRSRYISLTLAIATLILLAVGLATIAHCIVASLLASAFMLVLGKLKKMR